MDLIRSLNDSEKVKRLKSLKYGANKPLVTKDINKAPSPQGIGLEASRRVDDLERMTKFFASPSGLKYLGKETLLNSIEVKDRVSKKMDQKLANRNARLKKRGKDPVQGTRVGNIIRGGASLLEDTVVNAAKIVGSTLAQVPVNGTGTHFFRGFRSRDTFYTADNPSAFLGEDGLEYGPQIPKASPPPPKIIDFRKLYNKSYYLDYRGDKIKRESRVKLGDQGSRRNISSYTSELEPGTIDGINMLPPIKLEKDENGRQIHRQEIGVDKGRDLIKFRFEIITPEEETILYFRAHLDNFSDSFNSEWSKNNYLGRGEAFYTYGGFDRSIILGFKIAATSRHEMQPLYQKIVMLASSTAPTYSANFMRGTLVKLTVGDYVYALPGFLEEVTYTWQNEYPWEIAFQSPEGTADEDMQELPHILDCQVTFRPIHPFTPRTGLHHYITNPYAGKSSFFNQDGTTAPKPSADIVAAKNEKAYRLKSKNQIAEQEAQQQARDREMAAIDKELAELADEQLLNTDFNIPPLNVLGLPADPSRGELESGALD